jgi:hypothetical protein
VYCVLLRAGSELGEPVDILPKLFCNDEIMAILEADDEVMCSQQLYGLACVLSIVKSDMDTDDAWKLLACWYTVSEELPTGRGRPLTHSVLRGFALLSCGPCGPRYILPAALSFVLCLLVPQSAASTLIAPFLVSSRRHEPFDRSQVEYRCRNSGKMRKRQHIAVETPKTAEEAVYRRVGVQVVLAALVRPFALKITVP